MPPKRPPHPPAPPHDDPYYDGPPPPPHHHWRRQWLPIPEDFDEAILRELLESSDDARATRRVFEGAPPEIQMVGYLVLRLYSKMKDEMNTLHERLDQLGKARAENDFNKGG